jgi:hypothetical protein
VIKKRVVRLGSESVIPAFLGPVLRAGDVMYDITDTAQPPDINTSVEHILLFYRRGIIVRQQFYYLMMSH